MEIESQEHNFEFIDDYPPNSPDLNPIEHLWGKLKENVKFRRPKNLKALEEIV
jgi:transposase